MGVLGKRRRAWFVSERYVGVPAVDGIRRFGSLRMFTIMPVAGGVVQIKNWAMLRQFGVIGGTARNARARPGPLTPMGGGG